MKLTQPIGNDRPAIFMFTSYDYGTYKYKIANMKFIIWKGIPVLSEYIDGSPHILT